MQTGVLRASAQTHCRRGRGDGYAHHPKIIVQIDRREQIVESGVTRRGVSLSLYLKVAALGMPFRMSQIAPG